MIIKYEARPHQRSRGIRRCTLFSDEIGMKCLIRFNDYEGTLDDIEMDVTEAEAAFLKKIENTYGSLIALYGEDLEAYLKKEEERRENERNRVLSPMEQKMQSYYAEAAMEILLRPFIFKK